MSIDERAHSKVRWTWPQIIFCVVLAGIVVAAAIPAFHPVSPQTNQIRTATNCRQIMAALKLYAGDHGGNYPDADKSAPGSANQAFRILIKEDYLIDESCFGAAMSNFNPDGIIGEKPDFPKALEPGENHWVMTKGLTDSSSATAPLVFENPVSASWPPQWNADAAGRKERGRAWRGGKVIVGFNDSSVQPIKLETDRGSAVWPANDKDGKNCFTHFSETGEILDIEE